MTSRNRRQIREGAQVRSDKRPREGPGTGSERPSWRIKGVDLDGPFGQRVKEENVEEILKFLSEIEAKTWNEILKNRGPGGNHKIDARRICQDARKRLQDLNVEFDTLICLRMTAKKRIWGTRRGSVFYLLWWDPEHKVYPTTQHAKRKRRKNG